LPETLLPLCKLYIIPDTTYRLHCYYNTCKWEIKGNAVDFYEKKKDNAAQLVRAALYIRVSGEEQKIKGFSLEAQQERLEVYAKERG